MEALEAFECELVDNRDVVVVEQEVVELAEALEWTLIVLEPVQIGYLIPAQVTKIPGNLSAFNLE